MVRSISETDPSSDVPVEIGKCPTASQLLAEFAKDRNPEAFEKLTRQYGPMVYGVCRRVIGNHHDAEDAFQATFVALAQNAASIVCPEGITVWLYRVAYRIASKSKMNLAIRKQQELSMYDVPEQTASNVRLWAELEPELDGELNKLPEIYRMPILLVDIAGISHRDAARQIGCPEGTLASRLNRAHQVLADRLTRRGIIVTTTTLGALLAQNVASAAVPTSLIYSTVTSATTIGATHSPVAIATFFQRLDSIKSTVQALTYGKIALATITTLGILAASLKLLQLQPAAVQNEPQRSRATLASPFADIAAIYRHNCDSIQSLRIEYQERTENLFDPETMWTECDILPEEFEKPFTTVLVINGEKVARTDSKRVKGVWEIDEYLRTKYPDKGRLGKPGTTAHNFTFQQILDEFPDVPFEHWDVIMTYDGKRFRTVGNQWTKVGEAVDKPYMIYPIIPPAAGIAMFHQMSAPSYLDLMLYSTLGPRSTAERDSLDQQKAMGRWRLPYLLENSDWQVIHERAPWDDTECLVIESSNGDRLWLDQDKGFVVRRWTRTEIPWDVRYTDFYQITDSFHVPRKIVSLDYAPSTASSEYRGKPSVRRTKELVSLEVNQPVPSDMFRLKPPVGATVWDYSMEPLDQNGNPIDVGEIDRAKIRSRGRSSRIQYRQPENDADLKAAIELARDKTPRPQVVDEVSQPDNVDARLRTSDTVGSTSSVILHWFVVLNAAALLLALLYFGWRRRSA